jgi:integral membrane protein
LENKRLPLTLYRVLAYVTSTWLLLLTFVAMPAKYLVGETARFSLADAPAGMEQWFGADTPLMMYIAIPHGYIYMVFVLSVLWLALKRRWNASKTVGVMLSGTIPVVGFFVEHRVAATEKAAIDAEERAAAQSAAASAEG